MLVEKVRAIGLDADALSWSVDGENHVFVVFFPEGDRLGVPVVFRREETEQFGLNTTVEARATVKIAKRVRIRFKAHLAK